MTSPAGGTDQIRKPARWWRRYRAALSSRYRGRSRCTAICAPASGGASATGTAVVAAPPTVFLPMGEIAVLSSLPAQVSSVEVTVGGAGNGPLLTVSGGGWQVVADLASAADPASTIPRGATAAATLGAVTTKATFIGILDATTSADSGAAPPADGTAAAGGSGQGLGDGDRLELGE